MATRVFISYRREDSAGAAGRVYDRLVPEFGREAVFMDVDAVRLGVDFVKVLHEAVAKCDVLLAVIGRDWLNASDEEGNRRLDNQKDYVRIEITAALQRDIPVIPYGQNNYRTLGASDVRRVAASPLPFFMKNRLIVFERATGANA